MQPLFVFPIFLYNRSMAIDYSKEKPSPEEEIRELERKLEEKKKEFAEKGEAARPEKEVFREVLKEHIQQGKLSSLPPSDVSSTTPSRDQKQKVDEATTKELREAEVRALIEIALTRTIQDAVRMAERATPYLLDELHDRLADDYYEKLIALRKIKQF